MNNLLLVGLGVVAVSTILCIIATAIPSWVDNDIGNAGLWTACSDVLDKCFDYSDVPSWMEATRAMMILSILAFAASSACAAVYAFFLKSQPKLGIVAAVLAFIAGGLSLVGAIIFAAEKENTILANAPLGAGFGLAILVFILGIVGGVCWSVPAVGMLFLEPFNPN